MSSTCRTGHSASPPPLRRFLARLLVTDGAGASTSRRRDGRGDARLSLAYGHSPLSGWCSAARPAPRARHRRRPRRVRHRHRLGGRLAVHLPSARAWPRASRWRCGWGRGLVPRLETGAGWPASAQVDAAVGHPAPVSNRGPNRRSPSTPPPPTGLYSRGEACASLRLPRLAVAHRLQALRPADARQALAHGGAGAGPERAGAQPGAPRRRRSWRTRGAWCSAASWRCRRASGCRWLSSI